MSFFLLSILCATDAKQSPPPQLISKQFSLVYAKVIDISVNTDDKGERQCSTFRITHVYCGVHKLKDQTFFLPLRPVFEQQLQWFRPGKPIPWVKKDEEGVWLVYNEIWHDDERYQGKRAAAGFWDYPLPARKGIDNSKAITDAVTFAEGVEAIDRATGSDKYNLLERAVRSPDRGTATWAVNVLNRNDPDRVMRMVLNELIKDTHRSDRIRNLIERLDDEAFKTREMASKDLVCIGLDALPALCKAMARLHSPESRRRIAEILKEIDYRLQNGDANSAGWRIFQTISRQHSLEANRAYRRLQDLAHKHPGTWLGLEMQALGKLEETKRSDDFYQTDHWNQLADLYWNKAGKKTKSR